MTNPKVIGVFVEMNTETFLLLRYSSLRGVFSTLRGRRARLIAARTNYAELIHQRHYRSRFLSLAHCTRQRKYTCLSYAF